MSSFKDKLKREFHWTRLLLRHRDWRTVAYVPWLPYNSKFPWQVIYIIYRWFLVFYFLGWLIVSGIEEGGPRFFIYLTNWTTLMFVWYLIVAALSSSMKLITSLCHTQSEKDKSTNQQDTEINSENDIYADWRTDNIAWYQKIHWISFNIAITFEIAVMILFWALLYNPADPTFSGRVSHGVNFNTHLTPAIVGLIDIFLSGIVMNIYHAYMPLLIAAVYVIFTGIYYAAGGTNSVDQSYIYRIIDYGSSPSIATGTVIGCALVYIPGIYLLLYFLSLPRRWLSSRFRRWAYKENILDDA